MLQNQKIEIRRVEADRICSCNVCLARSYHCKPGMLRMGEYTPDLFEVRLGTPVVYLCRSCLEDLTAAAQNVTGG